MSERTLNLKVRIKVSEYDNNLCSYHCDYIRKIRGTYHCILLNQEEVDNGDLDNGEYDFRRTDICKKSEVRNEP